MHAVHRRHRRGLAQQVFAQRRSVVVVTHHPDDLSAKAIGQRLDQVAQLAVGVGLTGVGKIAGKNQCIGASLGSLEPLKQLG